MNYNEIIYTHPIPCVSDSYFITLKECSAPEMNFSPAREDIKRNKVIRNTLYLSEKHHSIGDIVTEGK